MSLSHDESLYQRLLLCVIHPLGAPVKYPGCRPHELARHLATVFGFGVEKRQSISSELLQLRPSNLLLSVQLVEARNLKTNCRTDSRDPYCILGIVFAKTPRPSPHSSPKVHKRRKSSCHEDVRRSQAIKENVCPKWQEEFHFDAHEYLNQALHLIIWDSASNPCHDVGGNTEKASGIKSLFRQLRSSIELGRGNDDMLGQCRVPLKDIPAGGCDRWFDLYEDRKQKVKCQGQLRLRLQLSIKQEESQLDSAESDQCSMEDYYNIVRKLYIHALKALNQQAQLQIQRLGLDGVADTTPESPPQLVVTRCKSCDAALGTPRRSSDDSGQRLSPRRILYQCQYGGDAALVTSPAASAVSPDRCSVASEPPVSLRSDDDSLPGLCVKSKSTDSILSTCVLMTQTFGDASLDDVTSVTSTPVTRHSSMTHLGACHLHQRSASAVQLWEHCAEGDASLHHCCSVPDTAHDASLDRLDHQAEPVVLQGLPAPSQSILQQFSVQNHFSSVTQVLMELIVVMELVTTATYDCVVSDDLLREKVRKLEAELSLLRPGSHHDSGGCDRALLTSTELSLFSYTATNYVTHLVDKIGKTPRQTLALFPPNQLDLEELDRSLGILSCLLSLRVWACNKQALQQVSGFLIDTLQNDVGSWVQSRLDTLHSNARDPVIRETRMASLILYDAAMILTPTHSVAEYFEQFDIDYFRLASLTMESKLATRAQHLTHAMDAYQLRYHKFPMNIRESSMVSLQFYLALQDFVDVIKANINTRELFKVSLANYQSWFKTTVIFWLQTFRDVCIRRMERALEIEKDVVQVTCLVKYSNSSVDVLSCFTKIINEWVQINFADPDIALLGVTKITDTICDGAVHYAEKTEVTLEKNGFYDFIDNQQFDVTEQLCISLNNIEHVRQFLEELPQLLDWASVTHQMALKHESDDLGRKTLTTLEHLVDGASEDMLMRSRQLLRQIVDKMTVDLETYFTALTKSKPGTAAVDPLLDYLDTNLGMFYERLEAALFPHILEHIWGATIKVFHDILLVGQSPEYYNQMSSHLHLIEAYFNNEGTSSNCWTGSSLYGQLVEKLQLNSLSSEQLMLLYYKQLSESPHTPREYFGHLGVKIGFIPKSADSVSLHVKVLHASHLPRVKDNGLCDAFVTVSLGPNTLFPFNRPMRTRVVYEASSPLFHEIFQFESIPRSLLLTEGAVVVFSVWQHRTLLPGDFIGEVILSLGDATQIGRLQTIDDTCGLMMALKRPEEPREGPFHVLRERCQRDKVANALVKYRRSTTGARRICSPVNFILSMQCMWRH